MRVTQNISDRLHLGKTNYLQESLLNSEKKIYTTESFFRASEDSVSASKAMIIRRQLRDLDMYDDNLSATKETFSSAETALYTVANSVYLNVAEKIEAAVNGTYNQDQLDIFANELEEQAGLAIETLNSDYSGRRLLGGTNNSTPAFASAKDTKGNYVVTYNGVDVNSASDLSDFPGGDPIYVDVGIGIKYDANYNIDPQTAVNVCMNGAEITGFGLEAGTSEDTGSFSNNFVQMIYDTAYALRNGDQAYANAMLDRLDKGHSKLLSEITALGAKQNNMDFYIEKNEDYRFSLTTRQNEIEGCDMNAEISNWETLDAAYQAALQMSSKIVPQSIFDFI